MTTFAAGNNADDVKYSFPANLQDVITVAASGADDTKASFSNWGYLVDVAAPGGGPDTASPYAAYRNILSLRAAGTGDTNLVVGGSYLRQAGTSMATPHVSGVAALLLSANPQLTVAQVESIIRHTARDEVGDPSLDTAGYDPYSGWGRLDAAAAVARAFDPPADPPILKMVAEPLEFDVPATMCPGQQWSLPVGVYNLGGGTMIWSSDAPDWLSVQSSSATTPSFPSVSMNRLEDATGVLTIRSPEASDGSAALPVIARVASDMTISNCSTVLSRASAEQGSGSEAELETSCGLGRNPAVRSTCGSIRGRAIPDLFMQRVDSSGTPLWTADGVALTSAAGAETRVTIIPDGSGGRDRRVGGGKQHGRDRGQAHPRPAGERIRAEALGCRRRLGVSGHRRADGAHRPSPTERGERSSPGRTTAPSPRTSTHSGSTPAEPSAGRPVACR